MGHSCRLRQHPAIDDRAISSRGCAVTRLPSRRARVQGLERDRVPVGQERLADDIGDGRMSDTSGLPGGSTGQHEPAKSVGTVLIHERDRGEDVAEVLAHLAAVLVEDVAEADDVAVRGLAEDERVDSHERVEPAAGLVDRLADEVGRELLGEGALVPVRVAEGGEGHRARVVPAVDDLGHAPGLQAALGARNGDVVDVRAVGVGLGDIEPSELAELGQRAHGRVVAIGASPDRQGGSPVAIS